MTDDPPVRISSGTMRALGLEVSDHARLARERVEEAVRPALEGLVADVLADYAVKHAADLPPTYATQCAAAVRHRFTLATNDEARRVLLRALWDAIGSMQRHRPSVPAMAAPVVPVSPAAGAEEPTRNVRRATLEFASPPAEFAHPLPTPEK